MVSLANQVKTFRKTHGISREKLARAVPCSHLTIYNVENEVGEPRPQIRDGLASAMKSLAPAAPRRRRSSSPSRSRSRSSRRPARVGSN